jgi:hypothetical protein
VKREGYACNGDAKMERVTSMSVKIEADDGVLGARCANLKRGWSSNEETGTLTRN